MTISNSDAVTLRSRIFVVLCKSGFKTDREAIGQTFSFESIKNPLYREPFVIQGSITGIHACDGDFVDFFVSVPVLGQDKLVCLRCNWRTLEWSILGKDVTGYYSSPGIVTPLNP